MDSGAGIPVYNGVSATKVGGEVNIDDVMISIDDVTEITELEARICKLEVVVARLKAEKLGLGRP